MATIVCTEAGIEIRALHLADPVLADLLHATPAERWEDVVSRALVVGARGLVTMGLGVNLDQLDDRVRAAFEDVAARAQACAVEAIDAGRAALAADIDPDQRTSLMARALEEFRTARGALLSSLDPDLAGSHTARFVGELTELLGEGGQLDRTLRAALDPETDGSGLARLARVFEARFAELRDLLAREAGRAEEAERGTAKGVVFEDAVEEALREAARALGGCVVERTSRKPGRLGPEALVGDFVVTLPNEARIAIEAKNSARLGLTGGSGVLEELDRAMANRDAEFAICVSARPAYPAEVGVFGVYGNRVLVVDDGSGDLLPVALRWAHAVIAAGRATGEGAVDTALILDRLERLRALAQRFSSSRRTLTDVRTSIESVREQLDATRSDLLELLDDLCREVQAGRSGAEGKLLLVEGGG